MMRGIEELLKEATDLMQRGLDMVNSKVDEITEAADLADVAKSSREQMDEICYNIGLKAIEDDLVIFSADIAEYKRLEKLANACENDLLEMKGLKKCECGNVVSQDAKFCPECGRRIQ